MVGRDAREAHREEDEIRLDCFLRAVPRSELDRLALEGEVPVDGLDLHSCDSSLAEELERVQVPAAFAALEVAGARAELIGP